MPKKWKHLESNWRKEQDPGGRSNPVYNTDPRIRIRFRSKCHGSGTLVMRQRKLSYLSKRCPQVPVVRRAAVWRARRRGRPDGVGSRQSYSRPAAAVLPPTIPYTTIRQSYHLVAQRMQRCRQSCGAGAEETKLNCCNSNLRLPRSRGRSLGWKK
jgi:hypothetical protein